MQKRTLWIILSIILILIIGGVTLTAYAAHYASTIAAQQQHKATGAIQVTATPIPTSETAQLQTFAIVSKQTTASYSVYEDLILENNPHKDAVGKTHSVTGQFQIRTGTSPLVTAMKIQVDLRTLQSDASRRDSYIQQNTLQTDMYPYATFVSVSTQNLPATYTNGQIVSFQLLGNMTMHGKTNAETFAVKGVVSGNTITGTATSTVYMTDFGMQPPNLANVAIATNKVDITITFTAQVG